MQTAHALRELSFLFFLCQSFSLCPPLYSLFSPPFFPSKCNKNPFGHSLRSALGRMTFQIIPWRSRPAEPTEKSSFRVLPTTDPNALAARRGRNALPFRIQAEPKTFRKTRAIRIFGAFGSGLFFLNISEQTKARAERGPSYRLSWFVMAAVPERRYRGCCPVRPFLPP